ncbi:MAG TPA: bifunctional methylenetetrahydrofolate dehydrogenase/methenyltetrahydrofolate cyclohydrolase FolD [Blastocatellia bacterium]|nr:bifunctional methylenetetrahydrofolate dehydrogenase/methenyltetrahydrofolate cyclohydrolase FolD [Blastocatellia bacterium]
MTARILSGREIASAIKAEVGAEICETVTNFGFRPTLAVVRVGEDPASAVYVGSKVRACEEVGIISEHHHLEADISQGELLKLVNELNDRDEVDGILVQLPLPDGIDEREVIEAIDPAKDVDGFHPVNVGRLSQGYDSLEPCTPAGIIEILKRSGIAIAGQNAVIVGRSNIVGKPMSMMLLRENATVTICHSRTRNLSETTRRADILVAAIGRPAMIGAEHLGEGSTVIDVGMNNLGDPVLAREYFESEELEKRLAAISKRGYTLIGDVNPRAAMQKAANFTPVPGGVGLLTVAMLMQNTLKASMMRRNIVKN